MIILGIETSCDETSASLVKKGASGNLEIINNTVATSLDLHATTGGIIPENAAREQLKYMLPVIQKTIKPLHDPKTQIDAIAVTVGPGLIGSLLVGVETAKTLSLIWKKPIIPVNHLFGHIYANWLTAESKATNQKLSANSKLDKNDSIQFPALALIVSGNHTDLVLMFSHVKHEVLGSTRDDAAGEAFDKIGRLIGLNYPAGPEIAKRAKNGNPDAATFPRPMKYSHDYDFSFSGLKTAVLRDVKQIKILTDEIIADISLGAEEAIVDVITHKTIKAARQYKVKTILLGGGVAANTKLREELHRKLVIDGLDAQIYAPEKSLCTDNAAMIAAAAFFRNKTQSLKDITVDPELYY